MAKKTKPKSKPAAKKPAAKKPAAKKKPAPKAQAKKPLAKKAIAKAKKAPKPAAKPAAAAKPARDKALPEGSTWVIPYLTVKDARAALDFYKQAFGFKERMAMAGPDGTVMHAEMTHEGQVIMLGPADPEQGNKTAAELGGAPIGLMVYVRNVDKCHERAVAAGAKSILPPEDKFYGDRMCLLVDPDGNKWFFSQHLRDVSYDEMMEAMEQFAGEEEGEEGEHAGHEHGPECDHTHSHEHESGAAHHHAHEHEHGGEQHSHEHEHGHAHGHSHDAGHAHEHTHDHEHGHGNEHGHGGHAHDNGHGHEHGHEGHTH